MQTSFQNAEHSIHQRIERLLRHRIALVAVMGFMAVALLRFDSGMNQAFQQAYAQGFGWIGTYMHHEHPMHGNTGLSVTRTPTISGADG